MQRDDFGTLQEFAQYIAWLEENYAERLFHALYRNAGNIQAWYNEPNKVPEAWADKMVVKPGQPSPWEQVGEIVIVGVVNREFPDWFPIGLPIGSEARLSSPDAIIHIDVKTHKEGDADLDRTQDVRPEQISSDEDENYIKNAAGGQVGDSPPKLPPYYVFGPNLLKVTISSFVICAYRFDEESGYQYLTRFQLFTVPNGILRAVNDYSDIWQAGKNGWKGHRFRVNLRALATHEAWRWREIRYQAQGFEVTK
jgi:hypothetical protein